MKKLRFYAAAAAIVASSIGFSACGNNTHREITYDVEDVFYDELEDAIKLVNSGDDKVKIKRTIRELTTGIIGPEELIELNELLDEYNLECESITLTCIFTEDFPYELIGKLRAKNVYLNLWITNDVNAGSVTFMPSEVTESLTADFSALVDLDLLTLTIDVDAESSNPNFEFTTKFSTNMIVKHNNASLELK